MLAEELLEHFGIAPILLAIIAVFWKGDEAIGSALRTDISKFLKNSEKYRSAPTYQYVYESFVRVFGEKHATLFAFTRSLFFSTIFLSLICFSYYFFYDLNIEFAIAVIIFSIVPNSLGDYLSLYETRIILRKINCGEISARLAIPLDFILSGVIAGGSIVAAFLIGGVISTFFPASNELLPSPSDVSTQPNFSFLGVVVEEDFLVFSVPVLTSYMTSIWIWLSFLGSLILRIVPFLNYALPTDEKPIRSIGIVATFVVLVLASLGIVSTSA